MRRFGRWLWRFMVIFSFVVNFILVLVLLVAGILIFDIKNNIAEPLVGGLYSSFVGLDDATIDWTIPVRDNIPVRLNIPLQTDTTVVLTDNVPLRVNALIDLPGLNAANVPATVNLTLPRGLELPVALDLNVPVDERLDVALDVRAVIPLGQTQLHDPLENLQLLFEPFVIGLGELPNDFGGALALASDVLSGKTLNFLEVNNPDNPINNPWPGFSTTAGVGYDLIDEPPPPTHVRIPTGIVMPGGIPGLDEQIERRRFIYDNDGTPAEVNEEAIRALEAQGILPVYYNGEMGEFYAAIQGGNVTFDSQSVAPGTGDTTAIGGSTEPNPVTVSPDEYGILPTDNSNTGGGS